MDTIISRKTVYNKDNTIIVRNTHESGFITYTGRNYNKDAVRTYMQAPKLKDVKNYILMVE